MGERVLLGWTNSDDVTGKREQLGPALRAAAKRFDKIVLLNNLDAGQVEPWLATLSLVVPISVHHVTLKSPVDYGEIHRAAVDLVESLRVSSPAGTELSFLLTSGTPPMGAVWLLLAKSKFEATLVAWSSWSKELEQVDVPFDIDAEFVPKLVSPALNKLFSEPLAASFSTLVGESPAMKRVLGRAQHVAKYDLPVLLEGESGTGKELLAQAIHQSSSRRSGPFVAVNCGAIPPTLVEAELFGHTKGAFTGADRERPGHFRRAHGGTLFLDEIGELPMSMQALLLRPLQENEVLPVGASEPMRVDVRIVAASHRSLKALAESGDFREDLYFRLAVALLRLPPLREREGDIGLLIDSLWAALDEKQQRLRLARKRLAPGARRRLIRHSWPGNVRELSNVLARLMLWGDEIVDAADVDVELAAAPASGSVLDRPLTDGFGLQAVQGEVARHYLQRAMEQTQGNKSRAAALLGLKSPQVLTEWLKKHGLPSAGARGLRSSRGGGALRVRLSRPRAILAREHEATHG